LSRRQAGDDSINAVDRQRDRITCGAGNDTVHADREDRVWASCEHVVRF
jgi:hypothetical protein